MALKSFIGRVLFVSFFVVSAWQEFNEFGTNGGPAAKTLVHKLNKLSKNFTTYTDFQAPEFEVKQIKFIVALAIALKSIGSLFFIFGSTIGAFLLIMHQLIITPILCDFYNYEMEKKAFIVHFIKFTQNLALFGGLMFFIGMNSSIQRRLLVVNKKAFKSKRG